SRRLRKIRASANDFPSDKFKLPRGSSNLGDPTVRLDKVTAIHRGKEFDGLVGAKESFVPVETDAQFGAYIAKELQYPCPINEMTAIMRVMCTHAYPNHGGWESIYCL